MFACILLCNCVKRKRRREEEKKGGVNGREQKSHERMSLNSSNRPRTRV
jgi:hypothetical protein